MTTEDCANIVGGIFVVSGLAFGYFIGWLLFGDHT